MLAFAELFLLFDEKSIPVLQSVLSPAFKRVYYLRPLLLSIVVPDQLQQLHILLHAPWPFLESGIQVAVPVLSALLGTPEYLHLVGVYAVESLGDELPV